MQGVSKAALACARYRVKYPERTRLQLMFNNARIRAHRDGVPFALERGDITIPDLCPVFGVPFELPNGNGPGDYSPSLDRIKPELGYIVGNIRVISYKANRLRNNGTEAELTQVLAYVRSLNGSN